LDGPVVGAARQAIEAGRVDLVLPFVPAAGEPEVTSAFEETLALRGLSPEAAPFADRWFFENVVRVHRAGEGAPFTGLKPAGLDVGPVIPVAERALETGSPDELVGVLQGVIAEEVKHRLDHALQLKPGADAGLPRAREYVEAMLGLQVWAHKLYLAAHASAHEGEHHHEG
jgi:hypothetical protein